MAIRFGPDINTIPRGWAHKKYDACKTRLVSRPKSGTISVRADLINHFRDAREAVTLLVLLAPHRRLHNESTASEERKSSVNRAFAAISCWFITGPLQSGTWVLPNRFPAAISGDRIVSSWWTDFEQIKPTGPKQTSRSQEDYYHLCIQNKQLPSNFFFSPNSKSSRKVDVPFQLLQSFPDLEELVWETSLPTRSYFEN